MIMKGDKIMAQTQNIVVGIFEVESEAYQALTQLKQYPGDEKSYVSTAALVKKENGTLRTLDGFDTGSNTADDMAIGGLVGALFGVLGGPSFRRGRCPLECLYAGADIREARRR